MVEFSIQVMTKGQCRMTRQQNQHIESIIFSAPPPLMVKGMKTKLNTSWLFPFGISPHEGNGTTQWMSFDKKEPRQNAKYSSKNKGPFLYTFFFLN